jgi:AcrR family transcriptional regulator
MDETARRILEAATRLHGERGFRGTTTRAIAQAAGVNEVTLFRHFASKEALLRAAASLRAEESVARLRGEPLPDVPRNLAEELTPFLVRVLLGFLHAQRNVRTSLGEWGQRPELDREQIRSSAAVYAEVERYLTAAQGAGLIRADIAPAVATEIAVSSVFSDGMMRALMPDRYPLRPEESVRCYVDVLLNGLAPGATTQPDERGPQ